MPTVTIVLEDKPDGGCRISTTVTPPVDIRKPHRSAAIALSVIAQEAIRSNIPSAKVKKRAKTKNRA